MGREVDATTYLDGISDRTADQSADTVVHAYREVLRNVAQQTRERNEREEGGSKVGIGDLIRVVVLEV